MMSRLRARESMTASTQTAMAHRITPPDGQWGHWEAEGNRGLMPQKANPGSLRRVGIGVRKVAKRG